MTAPLFYLKYSHHKTTLFKYKTFFHPAGNRVNSYVRRLQHRTGDSFVAWHTKLDSSVILVREFAMLNLKLWTLNTCFLRHYLSPISPSRLTRCSQRRKRRREIPIFLLNTSCPVTHRRKHFLVQRHSTGRDRGIWQGDSFDGDINQESRAGLEQGQQKNYRVTSEINDLPNLTTNTSFVRWRGLVSVAVWEGWSTACHLSLSHSRLSVFTFIALLWRVQVLLHVRVWTVCMLWLLPLKCPSVGSHRYIESIYLLQNHREVMFPLR